MALSVWIKDDTPFWDYAKTLTFKDKEFDSILNYSRKCDEYDILPSVNVYGGMTDNIFCTDNAI